jgi:RHS repeat-associated protein
MGEMREQRSVSRRVMLGLDCTYRRCARTGVLLTIALVATTATAQERITFILNDILGTPVAGLDASGTVLWRTDYDPFGKLVSGSTSLSRRWLGAPRDPASDHILLGVRQYDANLGRFISPDPALIGTPPQLAIALPGRLNPYAYGLNNPSRYTDIDGRFPKEIRPDGYTYTKTNVIGVQPAGYFLSIPAAAMDALKRNPSAYFPFDVIGAKGQKELVENGIYYLMARPGSPFPFPPGKNPVRVTEVSPTSFTFTTMLGHFDPEGSTIRFSTYVDDAGNVLLEQHAAAWADMDDMPRPYFLNELAVTIASMGWDIQAYQLKSFLETGYVPHPWPHRW